MQIKLVNEKGELITEPHQIRLYGWTEERYFKEAPEKSEFVRGEVILMTPISYGHNDVVKFLLSLADMYCQAKNLGSALPGPTIRFVPEVNREPDICFFPKEKSPLPKEIPLELIPPFLIEVSHTTRSMDLGEKAEDYQKAGVEEYWVVDMERDEMVIHLLKEGKYQKEVRTKGRLESKEIEGFYIEVDWLWQCPLPNSFGCLKRLLGI